MFNQQRRENSDIVNNIVNNINIRINIAKTEISFVKFGIYIPPIVSRIADIAYVNGNSGWTFWKNCGVTCIGNVPPDPATCITNSITPIAFPIFPNTETKE